MKGLRVLLWTAMFSLTGSYAVGDDHLSWYGYLSQGITQSFDSNYITNNNAITAELTELGLNGRYQFNPSLALVGQVVYLDGGNRYEQGSRIDYLFLDWRVPQIAGWETRIHLGRYKNRHWLYSATRDVPQTRATAVLPQSVYFDSFRDTQLGSDGVFIQTKRQTEFGAWEINWSLGRSNISDEQTVAFLGPAALGTAKQDNVHQFSAYWQPDSMNWRLGASWLDSDFTYTAAPVDNLIDGSANIRRYMLSMVYFSENWELSAELVREEQRNSGAFSPNFYSKQVGEGGYVKARYLFNKDVSSLISFDTYVVDTDDPNGFQLERMSGGTIPHYFGFMDTTTLAIRWDIAPDWRVQAEHHWVNGTGRIRGILNANVTDNTNKHWRMWSVQLMYWF